MEEICGEQNEKAECVRAVIPMHQAAGSLVHRSWSRLICPPFASAIGHAVNEFRGILRGVPARYCQDGQANAKSQFIHIYRLDSAFMARALWLTRI